MEWIRPIDWPPIDGNYYFVKTKEQKYAVALWENNKWYWDEMQDKSVLFGLKPGFIIGYLPIPK